MTESPPDEFLRRAAEAVASLTAAARSAGNIALADFRPGEPSIAQWVETAHLGDVSQPIETVWGYSVVLLAAREPTRSGKADPAIMAQLNAAACQQMAERQRQEWRDGLLHAAVLRWDRDAVESHFGAGVYKRLPRNSARFGQPVPQQ